MCAAEAGASDVHLDPERASLIVRWRLDGVLHDLIRVPAEFGPNILARLKVLAHLLTYESALPQEGRISNDSTRLEVRLSTFPTLHGERAVIRVLGTGHRSLHSLAQLGLPDATLAELRPHLDATSGAVIIVGPAGSGKTTTAYACLREIVATSGGGRSIASLEDPIEVAVDGVAQSQVNAANGLDLGTGLRSLLRLDPQVILVGEMRDRTTAEIALQAALTGQLVITTFHAGNCFDALNRLVQMGIPAYAVRNGVRLVLAQRLVRRLCTCARAADVDEHARPLGLRVARCWTAGGCAACHETGYRGRCLLVESMDVSEWQSEAPLEERSVDGESHANLATNRAAGQGLWQSAATLVEAGATSPLEVLRVLGWRRDVNRSSI
jgi:type II secretory ATPase GspE/PulE/Tfp pilus assembly ATPase PilB-like protein